MVLEYGVQLVEALRQTPEYLVPLLGFFLNPFILLILPIAIIVLYLLYTIRNRPKTLQVPSLMFIMQKGLKHSPRKFFFKLPINWLLLLHILIVLVLIGAVAEPFINIPKSQSSNDAVLIIDASMSMQAGDRFEQAKDKAKSHVTETNTIIAVYDIPQVVAQDVNTITANAMLDTLQVSDSTTALHAALQQAINLGKRGATIHIYSDGIATVTSTQSIDALTAQLRSQQNEVFFHNFKEGSDNVGIVNAAIADDKTVVQIKNYADYDRSVEISLVGQTAPITIPAFGVATADFQTPPGRSSLTINTQDEILADNSLEIINPYGQKYSVLYISNNPNPYLELALSLMDFVEVTYDEPPGEQVGNYDVFIVDSIDTNLLLPNTINEINERVSSGAGLIVLMNEEMTSLNWNELLPVIVSPTVSEQPITMLPSKYVEDVAIGFEQPILSASLKSDALMLASSSTSVAMARQLVGNGKVYYYGLQTEAPFGEDFTFPLLFKNWIEDIVDILPIEEVNQRTGKILGGADTIVVDPNNKETKGRITTRTNGFYTVGPITYAINTLSEAESDIQGISTDTTSASKSSFESKDTLVPFSLWKQLIIALLVLLGLEFLLMKWRGDV